MGADWGCSRALFLQGPTGPFFYRLATELRAQGIRVHKVKFSVAEDIFFPGPDTIPFRGTKEEWPGFFESLLDRLEPEAIFLFGDLRPIHRAVIPIAKARGLEIFVFEEGYLRPDFITVERGGVNGFSPMSKDPATYRGAREKLGPEEPAEPVLPPFSRMALFSTISALAVTHVNQRYPHYEHHRNFNAWDQTYWWVRGAFRKYWFRHRERHELPRLTTELSKRFYLLPLQVHCDFQVVHSPFESIEEFAEHAIAVFAEHADPTHHLVVKHHPMDRAYREYGVLMRDLAAKYRLGERLHYVHDVDLPTLLDHTLGTITMNSTTGIQSIEHGTPVKVLGTAVYDMPGLTFQGDLVSFLRDPGGVDRELYEDFRVWLRHHNQGNGNLFRRLPSLRTGSGVIWPKAMREPPPVRVPGKSPRMSDPATTKG